MNLSCNSLYRYRKTGLVCSCASVNILDHSDIFSFSIVMFTNHLINLFSLFTFYIKNLTTSSLSKYRIYFGMCLEIKFVMIWLQL